MNKIRKFILKDVRCFEGRQEFNIRPLTFLVGENSTGKSTVLGCMQALGDFSGIGSRKISRFDFNADPYQMGAFADIVRKVGGRAGRSNCFDLGFEMEIGETETMRFIVTLIERESGSEPNLEKLTVEFSDGSVVFEVEKQDDRSAIRYLQAKGPIRRTTGDKKPIYTFRIDDEESLSLEIRYLMFSNPSKKSDRQLKEFKTFLENISSRLGTETRTGMDLEHQIRYPVRLFFPPYMDLCFKSFAPIRSKPMRTYDPVREVEDPEGSGMPMTLMNMYRNDKKKWEAMQQKLVNFGKGSGLFANIEIKKHGRSVNDPFQLQVKVRGPQTNIIDVGYGVSQILPILVRIFKARRETCFLVQQPEVHLHPRGQTELCSLLIDIIRQHEGHSFVIETHSDAMVDRARIEIMKGKIHPDDVSLIYLEPVRNKVEVHNITFDKEANLLNAPDSYREFFLRESDKLLGF